MADTDPRIQRNWRILRQRWPGLHEQIANADYPAELLLDDTGPCHTFLANGIHLSSIYDSAAEARLQASLVADSSTSARCYGVGMGELPTTLLQRNALQRLRVVVMNRGLLRLLLDSTDQNQWLEDPRAELTLASGLSRVEPPFAASPPCLRLADRDAWSLRDKVLLELNHSFIVDQFRARQDVSTQLAANLPFVQQDGDVESLFGLHPNGALTVVAAGPTLDYHYGFLQAPQVIIAVDRVLKLLVQRNIVPRYVVSLDPKDAVVNFLDIPDEIARDITLIYSPVIPTEALRRWPGRRLVAYSHSPIFAKLRAQHPRGVLFQSGSVIHAATDLAVQAGAHHVLMFGADFCFPYGKQFATGNQMRPGNPQLPHSSAQVLDWRDRPVPTLANLRGYLRDLEDYITRHPEVRFMVFSDKGARIRGAKLVDFRMDTAFRRGEA